MADPIQVPEGSPAPRVLLCWKESKGMVHCDRMLHHQGRHSWEWDEIEKALQAYEQFHAEMFVKGRPLSIDGKPIDHTQFNRAHGLAQAALRHD